MHKYLRVALIVMFSLLLLSGTANALSIGSFEVRLSTDDFAMDYKTTAETVGAFLAEQGIRLGQFDIVSPPAATQLSNEKTNEISLRRGFNILLNIDGRTEIFAVSPDTVTDSLIKRLEKERGVDYLFAGEPDEILEEDDTLKLNTIYTEDHIGNMPLMYDTELVPDDSLETGVEQVRQEGVPGEIEISSKLTYIGGQLARTQILSEKVVKAPVTEIILQGTRPPLPKIETEAGSINYTKVLEMSATAYSAHYECTGKNPGHPAYGITSSGMRVEHGVVAVDPSVIPLGTRLYVEGYGEAIAADTGGAIVGNKIDLYHEKLEDARSYGRKSIKVYVLQ